MLRQLRFGALLASSLVVAALCLVSPSQCVGATYFVFPGPHTVQDAMALTAPGDSVVLQPGTYYLSSGIRLRDGVVLTSTTGALSTILEMDYQFPGIVAQDLTIPVTIDGITFYHGHAPQQYPVGGAILSFFSPVVVRNCLFVANDATDFEGGGGGGGALGFVGGTATIEHNTMVRNWSGSGTIYLDGAVATIRDNVIAYSSAGPGQPYGYGIACWNADGGTTITNNLFWANEPGDMYAVCETFANGNHSADPKFCSSLTFPQGTPLGDLRVAPDSPIAPGGEFSGIGLFLGTCSATPATPTSWGKIKAAYR